MTRLAHPLVVIELIAVYLRRESDVAGGQKKDPVALAALAEVQCTGALEGKIVLGSVSRSGLNT